MGGFCDLETLEAVMAAHPDNPDILNDPTVPGVFCGLHDITPEDGYTDAYQQVEPHQYPSVENSQCFMFRSDYNNWYRGPDAGRGGTFSRNGLTEIFQKNGSSLMTRSFDLISWMVMFAGTVSL